MAAEAHSFQLSACRELMESHPESLRIQEQVEVIEASYPSRPGTMVVFCKTIIETTCKTILKDKGVQHKPDEKFPTLVALTRQTLGLNKPNPGDADAKILENIGKIIGGIGQIVEGLGNIRSSEAGFGHGADAYAPMLDVQFAELLVRSADAVVGVLFKTHLRQSQSAPHARLKYEDEPEFNNWIDDEHETFWVFETPLTPSEALFRTDYDAYRVALYGYMNDRDNNRRTIVQLLRQKP